MPYADLDLLSAFIPNDNEPAGEQQADSIPVKLIAKQHPEYRLLHPVWSDLSLLYASGWALKANAERFLKRRPKEIGDVYQARLTNFTHENHLGTALDWYQSELFEEDPHIQPNDSVPDTGDLKPTILKGASKKFWDKFFLDCDRAGSSFVDKHRSAFTNLLLFGKTFMVVDLPRVDDPKSIVSLADEKAAGLVDDAGNKVPYLCGYSPMEAINWEVDSYGNLKWIIFETSTRKVVPKRINDQMVHRWYFYDQQNFEVWEYVSKNADEKSMDDRAIATRISQGRHLLAKKGQVPVKQLKVPDGLWLANRAMLAAISHLNTDNVLDWALFMAALAMPVIMTDADITPTLSETGFILLPKDSKYEWTEPRGTSFEHLANRLQELTENIFRAFYLIHQGRSGRATPASQSGVSKQIDMMPSKDILKMFGDLLRAHMQTILNMVTAARDEQVEWDVRGFEFKDDISLEEMQTIQAAKQLDIPSDTFDKELDKRTAKAMLPDANRRVLTQIFADIDTSPDKLTRQINTMKKTTDARADALSSDSMIKAATSFSKAVGQDSGPNPDDLKTEDGQ